jgi:hypothetical protein
LRGSTALLLIRPEFVRPAWYGPWNKGKLTGAKPALRSKHIWSIRSKTAGGRAKA